ncbi:SCO family protein [Frankia sp. AgKG'84/4]|uniref:SCO family protein n=1 Tax=Frankia sp. AgKG'84/4 TaxID=573490 RepID=UPI00200DF5D1|nr:SCO family protein [Frankia sp. AgKG'84/4]MCL9793169.1 SCO family protein [Frankia sp. AgKG'84/4]
MFTTRPCRGRPVRPRRFPAPRQPLACTADGLATAPTTPDPPTSWPRGTAAGSERWRQSRLAAVRRRTGRLVTLAGSTLAASSLILLSACAGTGTNSAGVTVVDAGDPDNDGLHGTVPAERTAKPALNLTDVNGAPFDLRARTKGKITLVFFGYTMCPDVCPTTMADLAAALSEVKPDVRAQISVVFVTTDPDRDTGPVLTRWLRQFDSSFIGVRGTFERIQAGADALGVPLSRPEVQADGSVLVTHGSQVIAFSRDSRVRALYLAGTSVQDYIDDLPKLTAERSGEQRQ